jgi:phage host-nuclease inhibitor protein Gam
MKKITIQDRQDAEAAMNSLAMAANNRRKFIAQMDAAKLKIDDQYAPAIALCDEEVAHIEFLLEAWAMANPEEFPKKKKSIKFSSGSIGFRDGQPKLVLASKAWSWEKALAAVQAVLPNFIRNALEIDKAALIGQADEMEVAMKHCGLKVDHGEKFFAKPNLTETDCQAGSGK